MSVLQLVMDVMLMQHAQIYKVVTSATVSLALTEMEPIASVRTCVYIYLNSTKINIIQNNNIIT